MNFANEQVYIYNWRSCGLALLHKSLWDIFGVKIRCESQNGSIRLSGLPYAAVNVITQTSDTNKPDR